MKQEKPALLLSGGRPFSGSALSAALSLGMSDSEKPSVAYIGTANKDNGIFYRLMKSALKGAGAGDITFLHLARKSADIPAARKTLESADIVFLAGGEVYDGIKWLEQHGLCPLLRDLHTSGTQFVGVSAGSIMIGSHWVRWEDEKDDSTAELFGCLGLVPLLFDTHAEDEDWVELKTALRLMGNGALGYGIKSGGAILADSRGKIENLQKTVLTYMNDKGRIEVL